MTDRLRQILALIKQVSQTTDGLGITADIGCDHGKISVETVLRGYADRVIAVDISAVSVAKTIAYAARRKVKAELLAVRQGDGFEGLENSGIKTAVITGLGGYKLINILERLPDSCDRLILSPQKDAYRLREYITANNFGIIKDYTVKDGRYYYDLIYAKRGDFLPLSERELIYGLTDWQNPSKVFWERLKKDRRHLQNRPPPLTASEPDNGILDRQLQIIDAFLQRL